MSERRQEFDDLTAEKDLAELNYNAALTEFKAVLAEVPEDRGRIQDAVDIFEDEVNTYFTLEKRHNDLFGELTGREEDYKIAVLYTGRQLREAKMLINSARRRARVDDDDAQSMVTAVSNRSITEVVNRKRLPKLNLPTFSGEIRDWLPFWSQFEEIDKDMGIPPVDKFQYLLQGMSEGTLAWKMVKSYALSQENYKNAVQSLKERYGRDSLIVKVHVHDLLNLVIHNANKKEMDLSDLYVQLSTQLRGLDSLGVTSDKCASIVYPLVECCLPKEILQAWHRDPLCCEDQECDEQLKRLMKFLKREVNDADNISLACGGLFVDKEQRRDRNVKKAFVGPVTAAGLLSTTGDNNKRQNVCVFCGKSHASELCRQAGKLSLEEKKRLLRENNRCFNCLKENHSANKCRSNVQCLNCGGKHETVMCFKLQYYNTGSNNDEEERETIPDVEQRADYSNFTSDGNAVFLKTLTLLAHGRDTYRQVRAVIDEGSHKSYMLKSLANELKLKVIGCEPVVHSLFGGKKSGVINHKLYTLELSEVDGSSRCVIRVSDSETISGTINCYRNGSWADELIENGIVLSDMNTHSGPVDILIGADVAGTLLTGNMLKLNCGATAVETKLGWTLLGETSVFQSKQRQPERGVLSTSMLVSSVAENLSLLHVADSSVDKLWRLDTLGILDPVQKIGKSEQDIETLRQFNETVKYNDEGRVEVSLPWVDGHSQLPTYRWVAEKRLQLATNKLIKDGKLEEYDRLFKQWEETAKIEEVPEAEIDCYGHYLQHRAVYNPSSTTTPTRPVFNASFKTKGQPSLNDCLQKGPNLLELIPTLVTRFRLNAVGVLADITKAFQQISVKPEDRDFSRFLWWEDLTRKKIKVYRHRRVVFGVNSSPFLLAATLKYVLDKVPSELVGVANQLGTSFYVDNLVVAVNSVEEALKLKNDAVQILSTAKMELRGWEIGPSDEERDVSLLGMKWDMKKDCIKIDAIPTSCEGAPVTRRLILSTANSVFDPLGFVTPFLLNFKVLVQQSWLIGNGKSSWDTPLPEEVCEKYKKLYGQLEELKKLEVPRWTTKLNGERRSWSLHVFVDGSKLAYAAVAYLRVECHDKVEVHLLQSRSRVVPVEKVTIPRTELLSCLIGVRLAVFVKGSLNYSDIPTSFYTDSSTALHWIKNDGDWGVFVRNRRRQILQDSVESEWSHIAGVNNPADLPSRGCSAKQLVESSWLQGPEWLYDPPCEWPKSSVNADLEVVHSELKKTVTTSINIPDEKAKLYNDLCGLPTLDDMLKTQDEKQLLLLSQKLSFTGLDDKKLKKLQAFLDEKDGLIKVKTKLFYGSFEDEFKCPVVLSSDCKIAHSIIMKTHLDKCHGRVGFLVSKLRENYWILKCRRTVRKVLHHCESCRRFDAQPVQVNSPPLPKERVEANNPFEVTGIDLAGPLFLKNKTKVWIVLFTCAVYRAIHLELVTSLETAQVKMALRRFASRRGKPVIIFTDNGTNFVGTSNELKQVDWEKIKASKEGLKIEWRFIPPAAPWWGGFWERMVGVVKDLLRRTLGQATLNQLELITILADVEGTVNERPISYVAEDPNDLIPITPALFLIGNRSSRIPELDVVDGMMLNRRLKYMQQLRHEMRNRFRCEYLGQLRNLKKVKDSNGLKIGDVVLVKCDNKKRLDWPTGKIVELSPGRDGKVRVVRVKTNDGEMKRAIQLIYPLEVPLQGKLDEDKNLHLAKEMTMLVLDSVVYN